VGSTAGVISGLSPGVEKDGEDLYTTCVPDGTMDIIIIQFDVISIYSTYLTYLNIQRQISRQTTEDASG
jgi:hypothetical protein